MQRPADYLTLRGRDAFLALDWAIRLTAYAMLRGTELRGAKHWLPVLQVADRIVWHARGRLARAACPTPLTHLERYLLASEQLAIWAQAADTELGQLSRHAFDRVLAEGYAAAFECAAELG